MHIHLGRDLALRPAVGHAAPACENGGEVQADSQGPNTSSNLAAAAAIRERKRRHLKAYRDRHYDTGDPAPRQSLDLPPICEALMQLCAATVIDGLTLRQHAERCGLPVACLVARLRQGWDLPNACATPLSPVTLRIEPEDMLLLRSGNAMT